MPLCSRAGAASHGADQLAGPRRPARPGQAPINPSDINTVQGKYPLQPTLPGTPGHEGVARVLAAGPGVEHCREGDLVVPLEPAQGTWRQRALVRASAFHALHPDTPLEAAATLCINPPTALAMLETFVELKEGDVIVQNGGTSAVGQLVTQLARARGVKTVSVIRPRPDWEATVQRLKGLGADLVTTDSALKEDLKAAKLGPTPLLGLNCVGGTSALALCKVLGEGGTLVTYGGMSMQPVTIPTSLLIFKDLQFKGFWLSGRFAREQGAVKRAASLDYLAKLAAQGQLHTRTVHFPLAQWREALAAPSTGAKVLLDMESS
ncbi:hypothetical protein QJQ45_018520 [Haematococcus lacustris]|nr:hypothetical protein QJQ45_018520 [Haematococcus lacustris]